MNNPTGNKTLGVWEHIGSIPNCRLLSISDTSYFYDNPLIVELRKAMYDVYVNIVKSDGDYRILRARVCHGNSQIGIGSEIGQIVVDFAQIGVCDRSLTERSFEILGDARMPEYYDQLDSTELTGKVLLPNENKIIFFRPAHGDGLYVVSELLDETGCRCGVEIDCENPIQE